MYALINRVGHCMIFAYLLSCFSLSPFKFSKINMHSFCYKKY